jgi:16S rRNA (guanine527-N7)-methyltransferase
VENGPGDPLQRAALCAGAVQLGVQLSDLQARQQLQLLDELQLWAGTYNLTSITDRAAMLTHHLLDSLAAAPFLQGTRIADLGTGAGFPGLPLAISCPERHFTLIDATAKKIRFVSHVVRTLALTNVTPLQARIEALASGMTFDTLIARALAPLPELVAMVEPLCATGARLVALKGRLPAEELAALPAGWRVLQALPVKVPGLDAERHVIVLTRSADLP